MDTNNFFSFSRIAMVMKREIMENWKTNLYRLIGIYAAFALVMILHMWTMSSGRSSQISFTTYCSNIMGPLFLSLVLPVLLMLPTLWKT